MWFLAGETIAGLVVEGGENPGRDERSPEIIRLPTSSFSVASLCRFEKSMCGELDPLSGLLDGDDASVLGNGACGSRAGVPGAEPDLGDTPDVLPRSILWSCADTGSTWWIAAGSAPGGRGSVLRPPLVVLFRMEDWILSCHGAEGGWG